MKWFRLVEFDMVTAMNFEEGGSGEEEERTGGEDESEDGEDDGTPGLRNMGSVTILSASNDGKRTSLCPIPHWKKANKVKGNQAMMSCPPTPHCQSRLLISKSKKRGKLTTLKALALTKFQNTFLVTLTFLSFFCALLLKR